MADLSPWSKYDAEKAGAGTSATERAPLRFAFYGRCSTEDNQDPQTSLDWQLRAARALVERDGGTIVAEFFDVGYSRSLPWKRRPEAQRLLTALSDPKRGWDAVVVGEGQRCWYGSQFSDVAPLIEHERLSLWVPELGGEYDPRNASHYTLMTLTGGMSRGERQRIQERVRLAMASQVENFGRWQGGRPPYGYLVEAYGPHQNPRKAAEGYTAKRLVVDPVAAPVVRNMFTMRLAGVAPAAIARQLNLDGIDCPSAHDPLRNQHRSQSGWQPATVRTILENGRYTGFEFWGRFEKREELLDVNDVASGYRTRLMRADPEKLIRSREQTHEALVSVEDFLAVQDSWTTAPPAKHRPAAAARRSRYALRGLIRCEYCGRAMEGSSRPEGVLYRCRSFKKTPGATLDENHQRHISVGERPLLAELNAWVATLFDAEHRADTVAALTTATPRAVDTPRLTTQAKLTAAQNQRRNLQQIVLKLSANNGDIDAWLPQITEHDAEIRRLQSELNSLDNRNPEAAPGVEELLAELDDVAQEVFAQADPQQLWAFYKAIGLEISYAHQTRIADVKLHPSEEALRNQGFSGGNLSVRRGT